MYWRPIIMVLLVALGLEISGQESSPGERVIQYMESLAEYSGDSDMISDLTDEIDMLFENRVNINSASEAEISRLFFLTYYQVRSLIDYLNKEGELISISELAFIPGFDQELARVIEPFITISHQVSDKAFSGTYASGVINHISKSSWADNNAPGLPYKQLVKADLSTGTFKSGITAEKDQGESTFNGSVQPDFFSGYLSYTNSGFLKSVIVGDLRVRFGQGLVTWTGFPITNNPLSKGLMRGQASISPYSSSNENNFFRGIGIAFGGKTQNLMAYISGNRIDATVEELEGKQKITSFYNAGIHNSYSTLLKKNSVTEYSGGFSYTINRNIFHTGVSLSATRFSIPVSYEKTTEKQFDLSGRDNISGSIDYSLALKRLYLFGEVALSKNGGFAHLEGAKIIPAAGTEINILYTKIGKGYNSFHGIASGRETINRFRESFLLNLSFEPLPRVNSVTGVLYERELWFGLYGAPPLSSRRIYTELRYNPSQQITINALFRLRLNENSEKGERGIRFISEEKQANIRANILFTPNDGLTFQSRVELNNNLKGSHFGYLVLNGFKIAPLTSKLSLLGRVYVWSTPDFDSRIYVWEDDLLYTSSIYPFYNSGTRSYLLLRYQKSKKLSLRLKLGFSKMLYPTGELRSDNEVKVQIRFRIY